VAEMELMCESVKDDYIGDCQQDFDTNDDMPVPPTARVASPYDSDSRIVHRSFLDALQSDAKRPTSQLLSEMPTEIRKRNVDCCIIQKTLPRSLVRTAVNSKIFINGSLGTPAPILKSRKVARAAPRQTFRLPNALVPRPTAQRNSVTSSTAGLSLPTNTGVTADVSVILLRSAQPSEVAASDAANSMAATQPQNVSRLIRNMLQQQNLSLQSLGNNTSATSVIRDENRQHEKMLVGLPGDADNAARLRNMLHVCQRRNTVLEMKLKAEQARVRFLLAEVNSLKSRPTLKYRLGRKK